MPSFSGTATGANGSGKLPPLRSLLFAFILLVFLYLARAAAMQLLTGAIRKHPLPSVAIVQATASSQQQEEDESTITPHQRREKAAFASFWRALRSNGPSQTAAWRQQGNMLSSEKLPLTQQPRITVVAGLPRGRSQRQSSQQQQQQHAGPQRPSMGSKGGLPRSPRLFADPQAHLTQPPLSAAKVIMSRHVSITVFLLFGSISN